MSRPWAALATLMLLAALTAQQADAQQTPTTLVSNAGQSNSGTGNFVQHDHAQAFTTGSNVAGYTLTAVQFSFPQIADSGLASKLNVEIRSDSSGNPDGLVATLTNPGTIAAGANSFTHSGIQLDPDTVYWAVIDVTGTPSGANTIQNTGSDAEDAGGADGWSIADTALYRNRGGGSWISFSLSRKITISGAAVADVTRNLDGSYTVPFDWPLKPPGLGGGYEFRLLFITDDWRDATSSNIDDYDTHVRDAASSGHAAIQPYADRFRVVGSTAAVDARDHTHTDPSNAGHPDAPIYWLNGQRVAPNNSGFWSNTWENWAMTDRRFESGEPDNEQDWPWTGTQTDGTKHATDHLGNSANVGRGRFWTTSGDTGPIDHNRAASTEEHALYGISPLFRVASTVGAEAAEQAVLSNLGQPDGAAHGLSSDRAVSFTTGHSGDHYRLQSVDIEFAQVSDSGIGSKVVVEVLADSSGGPDWNSTLTRLENPAFQTGSTDRTYAFTYSGDDGSGLRLASNTTYWVVARDRYLNLQGTNAIRATASNSERLMGLSAGWSIGDDSRYWLSTGNSWSTNSEALKIGLNLGAADPFVQFRTCAGTVTDNTCSTDWVIFNHTRHDPPPTVTLTEGGPAVTYQWRPVDPENRDHFYVSDQVAEPRSTFVGGYMGPGGPDRDRLICHTGIRTANGFSIGDPITEANKGDGLAPGYGSTAGVGLDRHDGCPFETQFIYEHDANKWRPVGVAAGQDSDAFDHLTHLIHTPDQVDHGADTGPDNGSIKFPAARVPLIIRDDDEWEQDLEFSVDDGATWTSLEDGGLSLAFPRSLDNGQKAHYFWVRLGTDPATLGGQASQTKRLSVTARTRRPPISSGASEGFRAHRVWLTSPAAPNLHTFTASGRSVGSVTVSRDPVQVEINVGDSLSGSVTFEVEAGGLYERNDDQVSTATPPAVVRTRSFDFHRTMGSCVGCQRLLGDLPDPVVERVGDLTYANLSDTGIDLSWPRVVGAEGYDVRWWSTTSPFADDPNVPPHRPEDAYTGAEPSDPAWNIRHLEPDTEYRAVVYYQDHGATQLSTASPVLRFTTLSAGAPVEAEPTSVIVERVPEVSIGAASGTITEGGDAVFTVSAEPAPDAPLDVRVHVAGPSAGNVVYQADLGARAVSVPTGGSAAFTVPTVDDAHWDSNGTLGATVDFGEGYRRSRFHGHAGVYIANNDLPPPPAVQLKGVSDTTATVAWRPQGAGRTYLVGWHRSFSGIPSVEETTTTDTEHRITGLDPDTHYAVYVLAGSDKLGGLAVRTLAAGAQAQDFAVDFDTPAPNTSRPVVSVTADGAVTEGGDASFTVSASPAPAADLAVGVTVSASGDHGAATGPRTVTVPVAGHATLAVGTTDDDVDEEDGSVTATVDAGDGYWPSPSQGAATVAVSDDDGTGHAVDPDVVAMVREQASQWHHGTAHVNRWNRVLVAFGEHDGTGVTGGPMTAAEAQEMADRHSSPVWDEVVAELTALEAAQAPPPTPEVNIAGAAGGTEGEPVTFTLTANPAPAAGVTVDVTVATTGDFGYGPLFGSVTIPASGSATVTVTTTDDDADEADGSVTLTLNAGSGYTVGARSSETVGVTDDDEADGEQTGHTVDPEVIAKVRELASQTQHGTAHVNRWNRVLVAFGEHDGTGVTGGAMTAAEARDMADRHSSPVWDQVVTELTALEAASGQTPTPEVSVSAGAGVTEGGDATFTVTASPAPAADLSVGVTVSASGDYGAATGARTVTIPTSGSVTLTVGTTDDSTDEADGSVTATANAGSGYTVSATQGAATVAVSDDDDAPVPEVSVSAGAGVTEGGDATFTVTASPAPAADLSVSVTVSQSGDYGAATGQRTVTVPTSGSVTLTVGTTDDSTDEADGSVTATANAGSGYTVSATQGAATVAVSDDDDAPVPEVSVSAGAGVTEGGDATFTVTASPAPAADLSVSVTVSQSGDYGAATGARTVTVPTSGSATLTVGTTDDSTDEADGSVTATANAGSGYTVSATQGAATVAVSDDDDAPVPEVSVSAGAGVTEGGDATFTVTASPAPAADLAVSVTVSQSGDYGAATGQRTVTVPTTGSATLTVGTADDEADEADGSVTATANAGSGYTVSATQGAATVAVSDDDEPAPEVEVAVAVDDASAAEGEVLEFRVRLSEAAAAEVRVSWYTAPAWHVLDNRAHRSDYTAAEGELVFAPGVTELTGEVWLEQDGEEEPDEHFAVEAFLPGSFREPDAVGTMTIIDDD